MKECAGRGDRTRGRLHAKRTRFRSSYRARWQIQWKINQFNKRKQKKVLPFWESFPHTYLGSDHLIFMAGGGGGGGGKMYSGLEIFFFSDTILYFYSPLLQSTL